MKLLGLSRSEKIFTSLTLLVIFVFTFINLQSSLRKSRDFQRKEDINNITKIVSMFQDKYGSVPLSSEDGRILGCNPTPNPQGGFNFEVCPWGEEIMPGVRVPVDPQNDLKRGYRYISNGRRYQIYGSLEGEKEPEFDKAVLALNYSCGKFICNFGRAPEKVPVNITLEEYEIILQKQLEEEKKK